MQFVVYHPWVYLTGGAERLLAKLMQHSRHEWVLATHHYAPETTFADFLDLEVVELAPRVSVERSVRPVLHAARTLSSTPLPDLGADALLVSSEGLGDLVMAKAQLPAAVYCHTPLKIRHCETTRRALWERSRRHWAAATAMGVPFDLVTRSLWDRYEHRFANSNETQRRIARAGLARAEDVEVLRPGVDMDAFRGSDIRFARRVLVAGRIMWQKNVELAIEAFRRADVEDGELVIAGAVDAKSREYLSHLRQLAEGLDVRFVIDPSDSELQGLYATATATIFTPPREDFGIVPLESMASGTPVLACRSGGVCETVVDGVTGWLRDPSAEAFAGPLRSVMTNGVDPAMRRAARDRARDFGWDGFAARIDRVMADLAAPVPVPAPVHELAGTVA